MSSKNIVNKDFYTMAGRDRPNERVVEAATKHLPDEMPGRRRDARPNFIPGAPPVGESSTVASAARPGRVAGGVPSAAVAPSGHEAQTSAGKTGTRSGSRKQETARRGGKAPGKARLKAGAFGETRRQAQTTMSAKRGTTRAEAAPRRGTAKKSRRRAA
jgi:hypothetical protein